MATKSRGFASMDQTKQRQIASKGGKAAHQQGKAHEWNSREAADAGRKGGQQRKKNNSKSSTANRTARDQRGSMSRDNNQSQTTWDDFSNDVDDLTEL